MPLIQEEGQHQVKITEAKVIKHRFNDGDGDYEVKLVGSKDDGSHGTAYLPITQEYPPNDQHGRTEAEQTFQKLASYGVPSNGMQLSAIDKLVGKEVEFYAKVNNKGYMNFYLNLPSNETEVKASEAEKKIQQLYGTGNTGNDKSGGNETAQDEKKASQGDGDDSIPF